MKTNTISLNEKGLTVDDAKCLIQELIDSQIKAMKIHALRGWEKNHYTSPGMDDEKLNSIIGLKKEICEMLHSELNTEDLLDLEFDIQIRVKKSMFSEIMSPVN